MASVTCLHSVATTPRPMPGKTYALLAWLDLWILPLCSTGSNGLPDAKITFPSVQCTACVAVHSALDVGLDRANTMGRSFSSAILRMIGSVNVFGWADTPMMAVGDTMSTASRKELACACSWAYGSLWWAKSVRDFTTRPLESTNQQRRRASASFIPSATNASTIKFAMPTPASPAP
eukprot:Rmarinus@m.4521